MMGNLLLVVLSLLCFNFAQGDQGYYFVQPTLKRCKGAKSCNNKYNLVSVNGAKFSCPGSAQDALDCSVSMINGLSDLSNLALVKGTFAVNPSGKREFVATQGYSGAITPHPSKNQDKVYEVKIVKTCASKPCKSSVLARPVNANGMTKYRTLFDELDVSKVSTDLKLGPETTQTDEFFVAGSSEKNSLVASNFFLKNKPAPVSCNRNIDCMKSQFCSKASCSATSGFCMTRPSSCSRENSPVCACDGIRKYPNDCIRQMSGVTAKAESCPVESTS